MKVVAFLTITPLLSLKYPLDTHLIYKLVTSIDVKICVCMSKDGASDQPSLHHPCLYYKPLQQVYTLPYVACVPSDRPLFTVVYKVLPQMVSIIKQNSELYYLILWKWSFPCYALLGPPYLLHHLGTLLYWIGLLLH